jgi:hypothetical protein
MAAPKKVDYERIEPDWRAGIKSPAQLAAEYTKATGVSVSHTAIIKHFAKLGVPRDLKAKVQAKAEAMVSQAMVTGKVSKETTKPDAEIIETAALTVATIRLAHRVDIDRARKLAMKMLGELEAETGDGKSFEKLGELLQTGGDEDGAPADPKRREKLFEAYTKVVSLPARVDNAKKLAETLKTLIGLEREAYGIEGPAQKLDVNVTPPKPTHDMTDDELAAIAAGSRPGAAASQEG